MNEKIVQKLLMEILQDMTVLQDMFLDKFESVYKRIRLISQELHKKQMDEKEMELENLFKFERKK